MQCPGKTGDACFFLFFGGKDGGGGGGGGWGGGGGLGAFIKRSYPYTSGLLH